MSIDPGTTLGSFEISGVGGMGKVYRAKYTKLARTVAKMSVSFLAPC